MSPTHAAERKHSPIILDQLYINGIAEYTAHSGAEVLRLPDYGAMPRVPHRWAEQQRGFASVDELASYTRALMHWQDLMSIGALAYVFSGTAPQWLRDDLAHEVASMQEHLASLKGHPHQQLMASLDTPERVVSWIAAHPSLVPDAYSP